jgi:hypothetical protein
MCSTLYLSHWVLLKYIWWFIICWLVLTVRKVLMFFRTMSLTIIFVVSSTDPTSWCSMSVGALLRRVLSSFAYNKFHVMCLLGSIVKFLCWTWTTYHVKLPFFLVGTYMTMRLSDEPNLNLCLNIDELEIFTENFHCIAVKVFNQIFLCL